MTNDYVFANHAERAELERLQTQERTLDWLSIGRLTTLGLGRNSRCLEAGSGAGSMLRWMASVAGEHGHVVGIDQDDRFFGLNAGLPVDLRHGDLLTCELEEDHFDFIHCRLVLMHLKGESKIALLDRLTRALTPGGWLVAVDSAFNYRPLPADTTGMVLWYKLLDAARAGFSDRADFDAGSRVGATLAAAGLTDVDGTAMFGLPETGGTTARLIVHNAEHAGRALISPTGMITERELDQLIERVDAGEVKAGFAYGMAWGRRA